MPISVEDLRSKKMMKDMADDIESYLNQVEDYAIIQGLNRKEYDRAMKLARKLVEDLRKGKADKVYHPNLEKIVDELNHADDDDYPF